MLGTNGGSKTQNYFRFLISNNENELLYYNTGSDIGLIDFLLKWIANRNSLEFYLFAMRF